MGTRPLALARHQLTELTRFGVFDCEEMQKELTRLGIADLDELNCELARLGVRPPPAWNCGPGTVTISPRTRPAVGLPSREPRGESQRARGSTPPPAPRKNFSPLRSAAPDPPIPKLHAKAWRPAGGAKKSPTIGQTAGDGAESYSKAQTWEEELKVLTATNHTDTGHSGLAEQLWDSFAVDESQVAANVQTTDECVKLLERLGRTTEHLTSRRPRSDPTNSPCSGKAVWDTVATKHTYEPPPKEEF